LLWAIASAIARCLRGTRRCPGGEVLPFLAKSHLCFQKNDKKTDDFSLPIVRIILNNIITIYKSGIKLKKCQADIFPFNKGF
jgi:hypothetical protein